MMTSSYAFFDVDETIIAMKSMFDFFEYWCAHGGGGPDALPMFEERFARLRADGAPREELNKDYYRFFRGVAPVELDEAGELWFHQRVFRQSHVFHAPVVQRLREHARNGEAPVFVSGSFPAALKPLADCLGVEDILATRMLTDDDGFYTGEIGEPQTIGEGKRRAVEMFLAQKGAEAARCYAYGDDLSDLPMLDAVGRPVAVGADTPLTRLARTNGWEVVALE